MSLTIDIIKKFEGLRLTAYLDSAGVWTIGYGHTGSDVHEGLEITKEAAGFLLETDFAWATRTVRRSVRVSLTQEQRAALISLTFNIGSAGFKRSTLLRLLNAGNYEGAADSFLMWNKITVDGKKTISPGLRNRRERERFLFLTGIPATTGVGDGGAVTGGEAKPLIKSKTAWIGFGGVLTSILTVWSQLRLNAPEIFEFVGVWAPALLGAIFLVVMLNRYLDSRKGVH